MYGLGLKTLLLVSACTWIGCAPAKPTATDYKEKLGSGASATPKPGTTGTPQPATGTPGTGTTPPAGTPPAAAGNATSGLAILTANCETAGCHKDNGILLTKTSTIDDTTGAKVAHRGVQPVFTASNIADIKAALAGR
ncbi:MAG TPA: hypothetical protein VFO10_05045 [Oligoflexus sp.]|uniref:hypothetical protein n=1 Tax=Oligoflexus sp. TaxID=1971216 RepID=UPI002D80350A|nr:hypothetical protein [Oligoflexus sp.]HET9236591.1 hypothetical protein [Oligoflexus sp.]